MSTPTALNSHPFRPTWEIGASIAVHVLIVGVIWVGQFWKNDDNLFDPNDVMMVQAVALPKSTTRMPDRATRTPDPPKGDIPKAKAPPPPPTASDMTLHKKDAPKKQGAVKPNQTTKRDELLQRLKREALLKDATAAIGIKDRVQTDPDGVDPADAILGPIGSGRMDPELARYVGQCRDRILPNWNPLPALLAAHPEYRVLVSVSVASNGTMSDPQVVRGSGDVSFDRSALSAVVRTGRLPPPPARYAATAAKGVIITLSAADLR